MNNNKKHTICLNQTMCWNADVSLNTFLFSEFVCLLAYYNGVISTNELIYSNSFIVMQLYEYFIWKGYNNRIVSQFSFITILLQPVFIMMFIKKTAIKQYLLAAYGMALIGLFIYKPWSKIDFSMTPASNGHLAWNWMKYPVTIILIYLAFYIVSAVISNHQIWRSGFLIALIAITFYNYNTTNTFGSMWCWFANVAAFYWLYLIARKNKLLCLKPTAK